jgi:hypothetical protein
MAKKKNIKAQAGKPIYTSNPKDPRLRAYNDSLDVYNKSEKNWKLAQTYGKLNSYGEVYYPNEMVKHIPNIVDINTNLEPRAYKSTVDENRNFNRDFPVFKKPVQPIIYKRPDSEKIRLVKERVPLSRRTNYLKDLTQLGSIPEPDYSAQDLSTNTDFSFTVRDENNPAKQRTINFPDLATWQNFKNNNVVPVSSEVSGDNKKAQGAGYLKEYFAGGGLPGAGAMMYARTGQDWKPKNISQAGKMIVAQAGSAIDYSNPRSFMSTPASESTATKSNPVNLGYNRKEVLTEQLKAQMNRAQQQQMRQTFSQTRPEQRKLAEMYSKEYEKNQMMQNAPLAQTIRNLGAPGQITEAELNASGAAAQMIGDATPFMSGRRAVDALYFPSNNAYYNPNQTAFERGMGALTLVGDVANLGPFVKAGKNLPRYSINTIDRNFSKVGKSLARIEKESKIAGLSDFDVAQRQMDKVGITSRQRQAYIPVISDALERYVFPYGYSGNGKESKLTQTLKNIFGRDKSLSKYSSEGVLSQGRNPAREDAWSLYLGKPQKYGTFRMAETAPVNHPSYPSGKVNNIDIYSVNYEHELIEDLFPSSTNPHILEKKIDPLLKPFTIDRDNNVMGGYNRRLSNSGLQYNDIWDLEPQLKIPFTNKNVTIPVDRFVGKPFMSHGNIPYTWAEHQSNLINFLNSKIENRLAAAKELGMDFTPQVSRFSQQLEKVKSAIPIQKKGGSIPKAQEGDTLASSRKLGELVTPDHAYEDLRTVIPNFTPYRGEKIKQGCPDGIGCVEQAVDRGAELLRIDRKRLIPDNAAYRTATAINYGMTPVWNPYGKSNVNENFVPFPKENYKDLLVGDQVGFTRGNPTFGYGYAPSQGMTEKDANGVTSWAVIEGFTPSGTPILRHGFAAGHKPNYGQYIVDSLKSDGTHPSLGAGEYRIANVFRPRGVENGTISKVKDVMQGAKEVAKSKANTSSSAKFYLKNDEQSDINQYPVAAEFSGYNTRQRTKDQLVKWFEDKNLDKQLKYKLNITQQELDNLKPVVFGLAGQETNSNDVDSIYNSAKELYANSIDSSASRGLFQIKFDSLTEKERKVLGINKPNDLLNNEKAYQAAILLMKNAKTRMDKEVEQGTHPELKDKDPYFRAAYYYNAPARSISSSEEWAKGKDYVNFKNPNTWLNSLVSREKTKDLPLMPNIVDKGVSFVANQADPNYKNRVELRMDKGSYPYKIMQRAADLGVTYDFENPEKAAMLEEVSVVASKNKKSKFKPASKKAGGPIPVSENGLYDYPNQDVIVPTSDGSITMEGIDTPVMATDLQTGDQVEMQPGEDYQFEGNMILEQPSPKKPSPKQVQKDSKAVLSAKSAFDKNKTYQEILKEVAKETGIDARFLFGSAYQEGLDIVATNPKAVSKGYERNYLKDSKMRGYPVDGFMLGLDNFGTRYKEFIKKGYLPENFDFYPFKAVNEKGDVTTAAFRSNKDALMAKAAFLKAEADSVRSYANKLKVELSPEEEAYFAMASYNGGFGNAKKMMDNFKKSGLKAKDWIEKGNTGYAPIHEKVYPRLNRALLATEFFEAGGTIQNTGQLKKLDQLTNFTNYNYE